MNKLLSKSIVIYLKINGVSFVLFKDVSSLSLEIGLLVAMDGIISLVTEMLILLSVIVSFKGLFKCISKLQLRGIFLTSFE